MAIKPVWDFGNQLHDQIKIHKELQKITKNQIHSWSRLIYKKSSVKHERNAVKISTRSV